MQKTRGHDRIKRIIVKREAKGIGAHEMTGLLQALTRLRHHLRGDVAGNETEAHSGEQLGRVAGAAGNFEHVAAGHNSAQQFGQNVMMQVAKQTTIPGTVAPDMVLSGLMLVELAKAC